MLIQTRRIVFGVKLLRSVPVDKSLPWNYDTNPLRPSTKYDYLGSGMNTMGALFNNSMLGAEPGAFVHRPLYAKRLVYDSIEWLMQNKSQTNVADAVQWLVLNDSITIASVDATKKTAKYTTARIPQHVADAAIKWIYGKDRSALTSADKVKRPGD